jgi:GTPase
VTFHPESEFMMAGESGKAIIRFTYSPYHVMLVRSLFSENAKAKA